MQIFMHYPFLKPRKAVGNWRCNGALGNTFTMLYEQLLADAFVVSLQGLGGQHACFRWTYLTNQIILKLLQKCHKCCLSLKIWLLITFSTSLLDLSWPIGFDHISPTSSLVLPSATTCLVYLFELLGFYRTL